MSPNSNMVAQLSEGSPMTKAAYAMAPLLDALYWRGTPRQLAEAMRSGWDKMDVEELRNVLAHLNFRSRKQKTTLGQIDQRLLPCLFECDRGDIYLLTEDSFSNIVVHNPITNEIVEDVDAGAKGTGYFFVPNEKETAKRVKHWFRPIARRFESIGVQLFLMSLVISALTLATPFFIKSIFDQVIAAKSLSTLGFLAIGMTFAIITNVIIRLLRSELLSHVGGRLDNIINVSVIDKLIDLPLGRLEKANVGSQLARLREFEGMRSFFSGPIAVSLLELPYVVIYLIAIAYLGGMLTLVPIVLMIVLGGGALLSVRYSQAAVADSIKDNADCQNTLIEILENLRFIKDESTEHLWLERYRAQSTQLALSNLEAARINSRFQTFSQSIMAFAGAATLCVGAIMSINGNFGVGSLIACMALVWRVLSPLQSLFLTFTRLSEVRNSIDRVDQLMAQQSETQIRSSGETIARERNFDGKISFNRVVMRYGTSMEPALAGISFEVKPGEVLAIVGSNGSGKSTIMKLIAGLYKLQAGSVKIDDVDTRQLNLLDLRNAIGYLPQKSDLFAGTIEDNLRVSNPVVSHQEIERVLEEVGILDDVMALPDGLKTELTEQTTKRVSIGFRRGLAIARTLLSRSNIMLFDEPSVGLDVESDEMLKEKIQMFRGKTTTIYVTHRPDYIRLADRVISLHEGKIVFDGTPQELAERGKKQTSTNADAG